MTTKALGLSKGIIQTSADMYEELESIRLTIINIRIAVSKLHHMPEARGLDVVANHIEESLVDLEGHAKKVEVDANELLEVVKRL